MNDEDAKGLLNFFQFGLNHCFVHHYLPQQIFENPRSFISDMKNYGLEFLKGVWETAGIELLEGLEKPARADLELKIRPLKKKREVALIKLQEPQAITEAFFVAIVYPAKPAKISSKTIRYFVLERTFKLFDDIPSTMLCEWVDFGSESQTHVGYDISPKPDFEDFYQSIQMVLKWEF